MKHIYDHDCITDTCRICGQPESDSDHISFEDERWERKWQSANFVDARKTSKVKKN